MNTEMTLDLTSVKTDPEGRYCLNDLHRLAGGEKRHQPTNWINTQQTQDIIALKAAQLRNTCNSRYMPIESKQKSGTYACEDLVYDYAMWVSPEFKLAVIRAFQEVQRAAPSIDTIPLPTNTTPAHLRVVQQTYQGSPFLPPPPTPQNHLKTTFTESNGKPERFQNIPGTQQHLSTELCLSKLSTQLNVVTAMNWYAELPAKLLDLITHEKNTARRERDDCNSRRREIQAQIEQLKTTLDKLAEQESTADRKLTEMMQQDEQMRDFLYSQAEAHLETIKEAARRKEADRFLLK